MVQSDDSSQVAVHVWAIISVCSALFLIPNALILLTELQKLRHELRDGTFQSKYKLLRIWSTLTIVAGVVFCANNTIRYLGGVCYVTWYLSPATLRLQPIFLGNFQLSRLFYCFAPQREGAGRLHNGYPQWVFVVMYGVSGMMFVLVALPFGFSIPRRCFLDSEFTFHDHFYTFPSKWDIHQRAYVEMTLFMSWDLATLLLYCFKVQSIARTQITLERTQSTLESHVHSDNVPHAHPTDQTTAHSDQASSSPDSTDSPTTANAISIDIPTHSSPPSTPSYPSNPSGTDPIFRTLYRVLTVTLFYEIVCIAVFTVNNVVIPQLDPGDEWAPWLTVGQLLLITTWTLCAHLMLDHNSSSYFCFIEGLHSTKLHYCCACYHHIVPWQLEDHKRRQNKEAQIVDLKSGGAGLPENDSYQTCTNTSELERNRKKDKEFLDRVRRERAKQRVNGTQKEGR